MKIRNKIYNIDNTLNKKIVLISDIHFSNKNDIKRLNNVLDSIKKLNPNYICISGDFINKAYVKDLEYFLIWLKKLSKITKVIMTIGNHEYYSKDEYKLNMELLNKIKSISNLYLLNNENIIIDKINFIGFNPSIEYYDEKYNLSGFNKSLDKLKIEKNIYNVLLCHSPIIISNEKILKNRNIDLILCGHTHGGIVPNFLRGIFKNRGLISPNKKLFPKIAYGKLKISKTNIIISSGITVTRICLIKNIFSSEIVIINI